MAYKTGARIFFSSVSKEKKNVIPATVRIIILATAWKT